MRPWILLAVVCTVWGGTFAMGAKAAPPGPMMIADFEEPDVLERLNVTKSAAVSLSEQDVVSGRKCLEVRVKPFSIHGDQWPYVFLKNEYFATPIDLTRHSRVTASVRNVTEGLATVTMSLSSKPYNDGGRNLEGDQFVIPGGSTMLCSLPTSLFRRPMNDPSTVQGLMFVFPPNETDAIYRIDAIQAIYDPNEGSPAGKLAAGIGDLLKQVNALEKQVNWKAVPAARAALRQRIPELTAIVQALRQRAQLATTEGWNGGYKDALVSLDTLTRSLGEFALVDKTGFHLWQRPRYTYPRRDAAPTFASPAVDRLDLRMAQNEFRDASWMVTAVDRDVELSVEAESQDQAVLPAVQLRWSEFVSPPGGEEYADPLFPLEGALKIPRGESRELWLTCDTRWHQLKPGRHDLRIQLRDLTGDTRRTIPVSLTVWGFALPSYDVLPNNAYVEYHNSEIGEKVPDEGVRHMKMYGVNMTYVLPYEVPWPVKVDPQFNLTTFPDAAFSQRVTQMLKAWQANPGQERLRWVFSLSRAPELMLEDKSIVFLSDQWNHVFAQWLTRFRALLKTLGIADDDWMLCLADESSQSALAKYEIPFAKMIKRLDPKITITCNASQVIDDPALAQRFFRTFDILQPHLDSLKHSPLLREFIGVNQRPLWTYRCSGMAGLDNSLYDYYRVYAWENLNYGFVGTGIWTYSAQGDSAWGGSGRSLSYNLVFKHRDKAEVVHSRRYEFYREGNDDYRYVHALRASAKAKGARAQREAENLVKQATADILANPSDVSRCEKWRLRIAEQILKLQDSR